MATSLQTFSFVLETKDLGDGKYEVKEISADLADPDADLHSSNRQTKNITLAFGLGCAVYYDVDDKEIGGYGTLFGKKFGNTLSAGLNTGIQIGVNLFVAKGSIRIFKSDNSLKLRYELGSKVGGNKSDEFEIMKL